MTKNKKNVKRIKSMFKFIFRDKFLSPLLIGHFDKHCDFITFTLAAMANRADIKSLISVMKKNKTDWSKLFCSIYENKSIIEAFKQLEMNPVISLDEVIKKMDCFDNFLSLLDQLISSQQLDLGIKNQYLIEIIKNGLGYLLYNKINIQIPYHFSWNLTDPSYETKYIFTLYNTKLFARCKQSIIKHFGDKINDLIVVLLALTRQINLDE